MRVLGVNGYLGSSRSFPDSLLIQRRCRDQMMVLKLKQTRKNEDVKCARGHHLQCVLGQTLALEVSTGHFLLCHLYWQTSESGGGIICHLSRSWKQEKMLSETISKAMHLKRMFFQEEEQKIPNLCICFLSSPFIRKDKHLPSSRQEA